MKQTILHIVSAIIFSFTLFTQNSLAATPVDSSLAPMLQNVLPTIVNIKAQIKITDFNTMREIIKRRGNKQDESDDEIIPNNYLSEGSGVIVDARNGYILTNSHVIADAQSVTITLGDGRHFKGKIIGLDKPSDIALIQIKAKNLTALPMANSNDLKVGDFVAAIGNPFGILNQSVTSGIVSALGRTTLGIENYENFIQTDAPINPGNSGGALINMKGQLVGINTAILAPNRGSIGIGFAIPINMAKSVMLQLLEYGDVKRGVLGIGAQDITPDLANAFHVGPNQGAAVTQVLQGSPAQQAGMQVGDIITAVNGTPIKNASDVVNTIGFLRVDSKININILRHNKPMTVAVTLSDPNQRKAMVAHANPYLNGVGLKNFSLLSPIHGEIHGILVVSVEPDTNAWQADIRPGDVITSANEQKVTKIEELQAVANKADKSLLLNIVRGPSAVFLVISKEEA